MRVIADHENSWSYGLEMTLAIGACKERPFGAVLIMGKLEDPGWNESSLDIQSIWSTFISTLSSLFLVISLTGCEA